MMNTYQIELVQATFAQMEPYSKWLATRFVGHLVERNSQLEAQIGGNHAVQREVARLFTYLVHSLRYPKQVQASWTIVDEMPAIYTFITEHDEVVAAALVWTVEEFLQQDFTPTMKEAWIAMYHYVTDALRQTILQGRHRYAA